MFGIGRCFEIVERDAERDGERDGERMRKQMKQHHHQPDTPRMQGSHDFDRDIDFGIKWSFQASGCGGCPRQDSELAVHAINAAVCHSQ